MRRKDREMPMEFAEAVADKCEWAVMSMIDPEGLPYCIPLSIARENSYIYFHCAKDGYKIECLRKNPRVCLACVGDTYRTPDKFTTEYESTIVRGAALEVTDEKEKIHGLRLICQRHTPANMGSFEDAIAKSLFRTAVWKVKITEITGKRKKYGKDGKELKFGRIEEQRRKPGGK